MKFDSFGLRLGGQMVLLFALTIGAAFLIASGRWPLALLLLPLAVYQWVHFYRFNRKAQEEVKQFTEAVRYRDFTRQFTVLDAPTELQPLRQGFNEINTAFRIISKEKETQYHYLHQILELVDTGILSYERETGTVVWMNESLKRMLHLPYLKTVHSLQRRDAALYEAILATQPRHVHIATVQTGKGSQKMLLSATGFTSEGKGYRLIAFQNVHEALDETESRAWQKLLSVLTHELMNSIAPISSLAATLKSRLRGYADGAPMNGDALEDLELGMDTIQKRSEGLLRFAETYRTLNRITHLHAQGVRVSELLGNLHQLMLPSMEQKGIALEILLHDPGLVLEGDPSLLEQVLINLVVNAMEAVREREAPRITLSAESRGGKALLRVTDNGSGIPEEVRESIFVPFFSTKKTGSGIGLSLCKQIVLLHRGSIRVESKEGAGTAFTIELDLHMGVQKSGLK